MRNSRNNGVCYAQACAVTILPGLQNDKANTNLDPAIRHSKMCYSARCTQVRQQCPCHNQPSRSLLRRHDRSNDGVLVPAHACMSGSVTEALLLAHTICPTAQQLIHILNLYQATRQPQMSHACAKRSGRKAIGQVTYPDCTSTITERYNTVWAWGDSRTEQEWQRVLKHTQLLLSRELHERNASQPTVSGRA